jgi:saccharopine dehydrogenase-like NADP-dependent oxidoreductase
VLAQAGHKVFALDTETKECSYVASNGKRLSPVDGVIYIEHILIKYDDEYSELKRVMDDIGKPDSIICTTPFRGNFNRAKFCIEKSINYFDPTEDLETGGNIAVEANTTHNIGSAIVPHCGLAPGAVNIVASHMIRQFPAAINDVKIRVGAVPTFVSNQMRYNPSWSINGLVNEYVKASTILKDGHEKFVESLTGLESLTLDGKEWEAFYTSGGSGRMTRAFEGWGFSLDYKTMRHPGHCKYMTFLLNEMKIHPDVVEMQITSAIPFTDDVEVYIYIEVNGYDNTSYKTGELVGNNRSPIQKTYYKKFSGKHERMNAIQYTTASGIVGVVDWVHKFNIKGFVNQEEIPFSKFYDSQEGGIYL